MCARLYSLFAEANITIDVSQCTTKSYMLNQCVNLPICLSLCFIPSNKPPHRLRKERCEKDKRKEKEKHEKKKEKKKSLIKCSPPLSS